MDFSHALSIVIEVLLNRFLLPLAHVKGPILADIAVCFVSKLAGFVAVFAR